MSESGTLDYSVLTPKRRPRLWPAIVIVIGMWLSLKLPEWFAPQTMIQFRLMMLGPIVGTVLVLIWMLAFSRFPWTARAVGVLAIILGPVLSFRLAHPSMQMGIIVFALPWAMTLIVLWAVIGSYLGRRPLVVGLLIIPMLVWGYICARRMDGLNGSIEFTTSWRWSPTKEQLYLAKIAGDPSLSGAGNSANPATAPADLTLSPGDWPAFRGANRDGKLVGVSIDADWAQHPPKELWRHLIGPGWGSFSVVGDHVFTQEQHGQSEVVSCYNLNTGSLIWQHDDTSRFEEAIAGPGPRATPTFADGKLYSLGAAGILNCLNPATGAKIWSRDVKADADAPVPMWGFSASPWVEEGLVTVITGGKGKTVMAYDALSGKPAWSTGDGWSYASIHPAKIDGIDQLLAVTADGVISLKPGTGAVLWQYSFPLGGGANRVIQPTLINDHEFMLGAAFGIGTRRVNVSHAGGAWTTESLWTSRKIKPYYNDMVFHKGNLYGFDGSVFTCIDPANGSSRWRASGYGNGQVLLIADQDLLLILSEKGEAALVDAKPEEYHEVGRFQALEGKTWNHPVIAHGKLLVRNGEEIACFKVK